MIMTRKGFFVKDLTIESTKAKPFWSTNTKGYLVAGVQSLNKPLKDYTINHFAVILHCVLRVYAITIIIKFPTTARSFRL